MSGSQTLFSNKIKRCLLKWANWENFHDLCGSIMKHKWPMLYGESTVGRLKNLLHETTMSIHFITFEIFKSNSFLSIFCGLIRVGNWMAHCILKSYKPVMTLLYRVSWLVSVGRPRVVSLHCFSLFWVISIKFVEKFCVMETGPMLSKDPGFGLPLYVTTLCSRNHSSILGNHEVYCFIIWTPILTHRYND